MRKFFYLFKRHLDKKERLLASKNELYRVTYNLLMSCYEEDCCNRETFRSFVNLKQTRDSDLDLPLKLKLESYYCVFYQQRLLYPLRSEAFNVKISPEALSVLGYNEKEAIHTYATYNKALTHYVSRELTYLIDYFR